MQCSFTAKVAKVSQGTQRIQFSLRPLRVFLRVLCGKMY